MPLSPEEVYDEVVRLVNEAETEEQAMAVGFLLGRLDALSRGLLAAVEPPRDPSPAAPGAPPPEAGITTDAVAEQVA